MGYLSHWEDGAEFDQLSAELARQDERWGEQNHPDGTGTAVYLLEHTDVNLDLRTGAELEAIFKARCKHNIPVEDNWRDILLEEVFEALGAGTPEELSKELNEVAAVAIQWRKAIRRRQQDSHPDAAYGREFTTREQRRASEAKWEAFGYPGRP